MMKIKNLIKMILPFTFLIFGACAANKEIQVKNNKVIRTACYVNGYKAPKWVCAPEKEGYIVSMGIAKPNIDNDLSMQYSEAMGDARDNIARQIDVKIKNMFKKYVSILKQEKNQSYEEVIENVSEQIVNLSLENSEELDFWQNPKTKELFLLVGVPKNEIANKTEMQIKASFENKMLQEQFKSYNVYKELKK